MKKKKYSRPCISAMEIDCENAILIGSKDYQKQISDDGNVKIINSQDETIKEEDPWGLAF